MIKFIKNNNNYISSVLIIFSVINSINCFKIVPNNREVVYAYVGTVRVGAQPLLPDVNENQPPSSEWKVRGTLKLQNIESGTLAASLAVEKIILNNTGEVFYQNKEMQAIYLPFKIVFDKDLVTNIIFKETDSIWSMNIKRAIASAIQIQGDRDGAYIVSEPGIHGVCTTEYYVTNKTNYLSIRKTQELNSCRPFAEGIHLSRSNLASNPCDYDHQKNVIVGIETVYEIKPSEQNGYYLNSALVRSYTMVQTFESTGESQFIMSELQLNYVQESEIVNVIDVVKSMMGNGNGTNLEYQEPGQDCTGGRRPETSENLIKMATGVLVSLADSLEDVQLKFDEPYDSRIVDLIKILATMDFQSLNQLYIDIDIGTSYRQETVRNIFFQIIPVIGTKASVILTRDLIVKDLVRSTTAVQLLISLPFHISELSHELVTECETLLAIGPDRPDVKQAAVLSYATLVYHAFAAKELPKSVFEKYVKKYFDLFMSGHNFEQKMLYLQGLSNLELANVVEYLELIIRDETQNQDIRFLASWVLISLSSSRKEKIYETFWPLFENRETALELRIAAFSILLTSNPTPARLLSVYKIMQEETNPHMINYYRTTILSLSGTTYPCYQHLRRLVSYMLRHLPKAPHSRFWVSGNYIMDYRDRQYGIGAMLQTNLIGDEKTDLPSIAYFKIDTEALGKFTGQITLFVKGRGLTDGIFKRIRRNNEDTLSVSQLPDLLKSLKLPKVSPTPLHLEIILQIEGKSVLSFFIDQQAFDNSADRDLFKRIITLVGTASHMNVQLVRSPFMVKYSVPTVLGTPASVVIQTTVMSSFRGNITQDLIDRGVSRSHQIDARHISYAVCKSESYNPFLNMEHTINREQGLLFYAPINNNISLLIGKNKINFSFYRSDNLTNGLSVRSRSITTTKGFILRTDLTPYNEELTPKFQSDKVITLMEKELKDIGVNITAITNFHVVNDLLADADINTKGFDDDFITHLLLLASHTFQLNSIHIGNNKMFQLLVHNAKNTQLEFMITMMDEHFPYAEAKKSDEQKQSTKKINLNMIHKQDDVIFHTFDISVKLIDFYDVQKMKSILFLNRTERDQDEWRLCIDSTYEPFEFLKSPHVLQGAIVFGSNSSSKICPQDKSRINFSLKMGLSEEAAKLFADPSKFKHQDACPIDMLKFDPPPQIDQCDKSLFSKITTLTNYDIDIKFSNMPAWHNEIARRVDHFANAFYVQPGEHGSFNDGVNLTLSYDSDSFNVITSINGENITLNNLDLFDGELIFDSKFDSDEQTEIDFGFKRSCSIINSKLSTFDDQIINLDNLFKDGCSSLILLADCSVNAEFILVLDRHVPSISSNFTLRIFTGEHEVILNPNNGNDKAEIIIDGTQKVTLTDKSSYLNPTAEAFQYDFKAFLNEHKIFVMETMKLPVYIQYNMKNILSLRVDSIYKGNFCGVCNSPMLTLASSDSKNNDYNFCV